MKFVLLSILLFAFNCVLSQDNFVYLRFNPQEGSASDVVEFVEKMHNASNNDESLLIIYVSNDNRPYKVTDWEYWTSEVRGKLLGQQVPADFYEKYELLQLSDLFTEIFSESVNGNIDIVGRYDKKLTCNFVVSEYMIKNEEDFFEKLIYINQLSDRGVLLRFFVYSGDYGIKEVVDFDFNANSIKYEK